MFTDGWELGAHQRGEMAKATATERKRNRRLNLGVMVSAELKQKLKEQSDIEKRTLSALCEILLGWAFRHLESAGSSLTLETWKAVPLSALDMREKAREQAGREVQTRR
jgi:hypothetical protein